MPTYLKAQASSIIASAFYFAFYLILVKWFNVYPTLATVDGQIAGAIINYTINRLWVFHATDDKPTGQVMRYALVWAGNLLLNAGGIELFTRYTQIDPAVSALVVSVAVGLTYNYFLQKKFVFK